MPRTASSRPAEQDETTGVRRITADRAFRNRRSDEQSAEDGPPVRAKRGLSLGVMVRFARSHALTVFPERTPPPRARQLTRKRGAPGANKNLKLEDLLVKQGTWMTCSSHVGGHWWEIKC